MKSIIRNGLSGVNTFFSHRMHFINWLAVNAFNKFQQIGFTVEVSNFHSKLCFRSIIIPSIKYAERTSGVSLWAIIRSIAIAYNTSTFHQNRHAFIIILNWYSLVRIRVCACFEFRWIVKRNLAAKEYESSKYSKFWISNIFYR